MRLSILAAILTLLLASAVQGAEPQPTTVSFIVSVRNPLRNLTEGDLRRMYLGEITRLGNGDRVALYVRPADSPEGRLFLDQVIRMSDIDYSQWWLGAVFRGRASSAPQVVAGIDALRKAVAADPDAIGFEVTTSGSPGPDLVVLTVDGKSPTDPGYPIRAR